MNFIVVNQKTSDLDNFNSSQWEKLCNIRVGYPGDKFAAYVYNVHAGHIDTFAPKPHDTRPTSL